jgi:hypothetical protein
MPVYHESVTKLDVSKASGGEVVLPPRDLGTMPRRVFTFACAGGTGKLGLADAKVQLGPTADGPWLDESLTGTGIPTLGAGQAAAYRMDKADRWVRVLAQGASGEGETDLTVYLDAVD